MPRQSAHSEQPLPAAPPSLLKRVARLALAAATGGTWISLGMLLLAGDRLLRKRERTDELADLYA